MVRVSPGDQRFERGRKRVAELGQFVFDARRDLGGTRSPPSHAIRRRSTPRPAKKADAWNKDGLAELLRGHDAVVRALSALFVEGEFRLGKDALLTIDKGSSISFEDCAVALVDEIEKPAHSRQRFTVGY